MNSMALGKEQLRQCLRENKKFGLNKVTLTQITRIFLNISQIKDQQNNKNIF